MQTQTREINNRLEDRIRESEAVHERSMVLAAESAAERESFRWNMEHANLIESIEEETREACAAICDRWPDNLMAKHLAKLIRGASA